MMLGILPHPLPRRAGGRGTQLGRYQVHQGRPLPFVEIRARGDEGLVPWDGISLGELELRGPWVASAYHATHEGLTKEHGRP